jgi:hypothetical protein
MGAGGIEPPRGRCKQIYPKGYTFLEIPHFKHFSIIIFLPNTRNLKFSLNSLA